MVSRLQDPKFLRPFSVVASVLMFNLAVPSSLYAYDPTKPVKVKQASEEALPKAKTRLLTAEEMESRKGRALGNPYYAGQTKFDVVYKGVNIRTGNYSLSATDVNFEGGYGIPVNVTRSYSANSIDEGPFGVGWSLSADLRSTAGGLLKSSSAPVRSVPTEMRRRPTTEVDPNLVSQPVEAVVVTDAEGKETTVQRDVDGILTGPAWDKNEYETEYEYVQSGSSVYWVLTKNKAMTPDGTVYQYEKKGAYPNGSKPWNDSNATAEPNNVLKPVWVEDRHGNRTEYHYGTGDVTFVKSNGTVTEKPLVQVEMPNGRTIDFTWTGNRISKARVWNVSDTTEYEVGYEYDLSSRLSSVTTPGEKTTAYGYNQNLLTSITDPRGMVTTIDYFGQSDGVQRAYKIVEPNGRTTYFGSPELPQNLAMGYVFGSVTEWFVPVVQYANPESMSLHFQIVTSGNNIIVATRTGAPNDNDAFSFIKKTYNIFSHDLVEEYVSFTPPAYVPHGSMFAHMNKFVRTKNFAANFFGNPLKEIVREYTATSPTSKTLVREITTETAYWGEDKYFQQKAVRVSASGMADRYSYTDYYDDTAAGSKGQTYRVYDNKHANFTDDPYADVPDYAVGQPGEWKYTVVPSDPSKYSAQFEYDAKGRAAKVWKLQRVVSGNHEYVLTESAYGADNWPAYGNAVEVVEDAGSGKINRKTETLAFDLMGRAVHTRDGMGREFVTDYDLDGVVQSVSKLNSSGPSTPVATYVYGDTHGTVENGQPVTVVDELSGVVQTITYVQSGLNKGLPLTVSENAGSGQVSSTTYEYGFGGVRTASTAVTPNGTTRYAYHDYMTLGDAMGQQRVFTRINRQENVGGVWQDGPEEVRYLYDFIGRLKEVRFAPTPQTGESNYNTYPAASYASAYYDYDPAQRVLSVQHHWNTLSGSSYVKSSVSATSAAYAHPLGLKTSTSFYSAGTGANFVLDRTEEYVYDADFDYLTGVDYNDGLANEVQTWSYDAAGNRASASATPGTWTYDNLNRMTASPGTTYVYNPFGERNTKLSASGETNYSWDLAGRLWGLNTPNADVSYLYRADGMRVRKDIGDGTSSLAARTFYDGQMPVEEDEHVEPGAVSKVTRNFVGGRGLEAITTVTSSGTDTAYPLYDIHGNMVATLSKSGSGWNLGNQRSYDVWGGVRSGASTGGPKGRYVANLGHVQDDESGLIYMRARYYEPSSGRFVNEDPARDGSNWYLYCSSLPTSLVDFDGRSDTLPSVSVGMSGSANLAGTYNNIFIVGQLQARGTQLYIQIQFAAGTQSGRLGIGATVAMLRTKAQEGNFQSILMNFELVAGGRFGPVAQRVVQEINRLGDSGQLIQNGDFTQIYWLMQAFK